ncbi:hypothetical protein [Treponema pectinovorum]|uniref:hypothetical protein n=1 Tax=Treponema pectinovorum TaxID=164 RepID=UPI0011CC5E93|nr:hypothetical protein [Treponema pectinovorum]
MSVLIAFATVGFIFIDDVIAKLSYIEQNPAFFVFAAICGFLCTSFWKIFLPLIVLSYILISVFTGSHLYKRFGAMPNFIPITVNQSSVNCDGFDFFIDSPQKKSLVVEVYTLPSILIIPLPRLWYSVIGVVDSDYVDDGSDIREKSVFSGKDLKTKENDSFCIGKKKFDLYRKWIFSNRKYILVPLPNEENLPSVYKLNFKESDEILYCSLSKSL